MPLGPGKYDDIAEIAVTLTGADAVLVMVINGRKGNGLSMRCVDIALVDLLPALLREMANRLEAGEDH